MALTTKEQEYIGGESQIGAGMGEDTGVTNIPDYRLNPPQEPAPLYMDPQFGEGKPSLKSKVGTGMQVGGQIISDLSQARAALSTEDYYNELNKWKQMGNYWFDPNSEVEPDIESYLRQMPSKTDALLKGTFTRGAITRNQTGFGIAGLATGLDPAFGLAALVSKDKPGMFEYAYHKGGRGALIGTALGGWAGAIVGGVAGLVEGIFTWGSAQKEDEEARKKERAAYERALAEWQAKRKKMIFNKNLNYQQARLNYIRSQRAEEEAEEKQKKQSRHLNARQRRDRLSAAIKDMMVAKNMKRRSFTVPGMGM